MSRDRRKRPGSSTAAVKGVRSVGPIPRHDAHPATSLEDKGLLIWICWWWTFAARLDARYLLLTLNISSFDHPGRAFAVLLGRNDASTDPAKHRHGAQIKHPSRFG